MARELFHEARAGAVELQGLQPLQLQVVARLMERLVTGTDLSAVCAGIMDGARELLGADRCAVFRRNARKRNVECVASVGLSGEFLSAAGLLSPRNPVAAATLRGELSVFEDVEADPRTPAVIPAFRRAGFRTAVVCPMTFRNRFTGALTIHYDTVRHITESEKSLIRFFAALAGAAFENGRVHTENGNRAERLRVLNEVGLALSRTLDLTNLYEVVYAEIGRVLRRDSFYIALYDAQRDEIRYEFTADRGVFKMSGGATPLAMGPSAWVVRNRRPYVLARGNEAIQRSGTFVGSGEHSRSAIHVPMMLGARVLGAISVQSYSENAYNDEDLRLMQVIASHTAVAVENARLFAAQDAALEENRRLHAESARLADRLRVLNEAGVALSGVLNLDALCDVVALQTACVLRMDCFYIAFWNAERQTLTYSFFENGTVLERNIEAGVGTGPSGWVVKNRLPHLTCTGDDPIHQSGHDYGQGPETLSACHVPLMLGERVVGVMSAQSYAANAYSEEDVQILQTLAGQAAVAVENARLYRAVQEASLTDELTGLPNRRAAVRRVEEELSRAARYGYSLCVLILDLDFFKTVNDTFGHPVGDEVLREISVLLRGSLRAHDSLGRWGGEEFIVLLVHTDLEGGRVVAENLRRRVEQYAFFGGRMERPLTVSIGGMAIEPPAQWEPGAVVATADACLYEAKETGRNRVVFLDS